ncbi:hypothetical protein [uncultured Proteiniphilum sp.]|uniref:hypothetical protein n=1 Tax=uncultured Proteiniphilum sp. TaxID=497637 RepID=UPI0026235D2A|nr:hypothetical protein [uncultured Proteiniphilum sp.]
MSTMPGFNNLFTRCRGLLRKKQSKGHGVHSPFAFDLITSVIHSPYSFYAFSDIREILWQNGLDPNLITGFNRLSFRLVHYFQAGDILEINSGTGLNTLFLTAPSSHIHCRCVEEDKDKIAVAERLLKQAGRIWERGTVSSLSACEGKGYDAVFINLTGKNVPDIPILTKLSHPNTFWVLHPIKKGRAKQFWNEIVHDEKARITFDVKDTGIVFLRPDFHKANYLV